MMFRWDARNKDRPVWSQAFSPEQRQDLGVEWFNVYRNESNKNDQ